MFATFAEIISNEMISAAQYSIYEELVKLQSNQFAKCQCNPEFPGNELLEQPDGISVVGLRLANTHCK